MDRHSIIAVTRHYMHPLISLFRTTSRRNPISISTSVDLCARRSFRSIPLGRADLEMASRAASLKRADDFVDFLNASPTRRLYQTS